MTTTKQSANLKDNAPDGVDLSDREAAAARKEGAKEAETETGKGIYKMLTDGEPAGDPPVYVSSSAEETTSLAPMLDLSADEFAKVVANDGDDGLAEEKVTGLLKLERAGRNRTLHVQALCKRLDVKSPYDVTSAGPPYTNDVTPTTAL